MRKVYSYIGETLNGRVVTNLIYGESIEDATERLSGLGIKAMEINLSYGNTYKVLRSGQSFDGRQLSQFYSTVGRRVNNGANIQVAVEESGEFISDPRLAIAISILSTGLEDGVPLAQAMKMAEFPERDLEIVGNLRGAGNIGHIFERIGKEYRRLDAMNRSLKSMTLEPQFLFVAAMVVGWFTLLYAGPSVEKAITQIPNAHVPAYAATIYAIGGYLKQNAILNTLIFAACMVSLFVFFHSPYFARALDVLPIFKRLSERSDHAQLWSSFGILYDAASVERPRIPVMLADTVSRQDTRESLLVMAEHMAAGNSPVSALRLGGFPSYVTRGVGNALSTEDANAIVRELRIVSENLSEDVELLTERLKTIVGNTLKVLLGLIVGGIAFITVVPMVMTTMSAA